MRRTSYDLTIDEVCAKYEAIVDLINHPERIDWNELELTNARRLAYYLNIGF